MIGIGVLGYGYWGPNLARNFSTAPGCSVKAVADLRQGRLDAVRGLYPAVRTTTDFAEIISAPDVDAVAIATPVSSHFDLAMAALCAGKHVLIEKPMTASTDQARRLIDEADRRNRVLFVDHTFVYTGAVRKIRELITNGSVGDLYYYDSTRVNLGLFQHDVNVLWDLAVHDLAIMDFIMPRTPVAVSATGVSHVNGGPENTAYVTAFFDNHLIGHVHANWLAPVKVRRTLIGGSQKMIVYDDLEVSEKIKVYDKGITVTESDDAAVQLRVGYRTGDMWAPQLEGAEALGVMIRHFLQCITDRTVAPITGGQAGLHVVQILEAATRSMAERGRVVELSPMGQIV
jgi:predicted dehydrogenase